MSRWLKPLTLTCLVLSGCGGSSAPSQPAPPPPISVAPPPVADPVPRPQPVAGNTPPAPRKSPTKAPAVELPSVQDFEKLDDLNNFSVLDGPDPAAVFSVDDSQPEGMFVTVEVPAPEVPVNAQALPEGFTAQAGTTYTEDGWPLRIVSTADDKVMACVPAGLFTQGTDQGPPDCVPAHPMSLDTYYIDVTEVSVGEFIRFKTAMQGQDTAPAATVPLSGDPRLPVMKLSWKDAQNYAKWAKKDLPTEAEWEKAARGPDGAVYPWGNDRPIWDRPRLPGQLHPAGAYPHDRSRYGVLDLAGNAREWCLDWYSDKAYTEARSKDGSPAHNWTGPRKASNGERVIKGSDTRWELWSRGSHSMTKPVEGLGFRCVLRLTPAAHK